MASRTARICSGGGTVAQEHWSKGRGRVGMVRVAGYRVEHGASESLEQRVEGRTCGSGGCCDILVSLWK